MIKIQNIYYMLCYAFKTIDLKEQKDISKEEFDNVNNLFAQILINSVSFQLKRGIKKDYIEYNEQLISPKGKIIFADSISSGSIMRKRLVCEYEEMSENILANQVIKATFKLLVVDKNVTNKRKKEIRNLLLYFNNVKMINISDIKWNDIKYNHNNKTYHMILSICKLVIESMVINNIDGSMKIASFMDQQTIYSLYEKFILEYYKKHYPELRPKASQIKWEIDGIDDYLPIMKSDITLTGNGKILIIDAKYYQNSKIHSFYSDKKKYISSNIYQIYTYVKNKQANYDKHVDGILLYAETNSNSNPDSDYNMGGNIISLKSLSLNCDFDIIKNQLNTIITTNF